MDFNKPEIGDFDSYRRCDYCSYFRNDAFSKQKKCMRHLKYSDECFRPNAYIIPKLCGSCDYRNQFCKDKHFCTGKENNRHSAFPDKVRSWDEWHDNAELDTCDNWKEKMRQPK